MSNFDPNWSSGRVNPGAQLTVRLEREGGLADAPDRQQVREELGRDPAVAAQLGDCQALTDDPTNILCGEYHVPVTVTAGTPRVLGEILPRRITVRSGGAFGTQFLRQQQTWKVTGARHEGVAPDFQVDQERREQENPAPESDGPSFGGLLTELLGLPLIVLVIVGLLIFALTPAGQTILEGVTGGGT